MELAGTVYLSKAKFLVLSLLSVQLGVLTSNSINESDVAEYLIQRRKNVGDIFSVVFKPECSKLSCNPRDVNWCGNFSASSFSSSDGRYKCSCLNGLTFLPELGTCVKHVEVVNHFNGSAAGGCTAYANGWPWESLFMRTLDFGVNGSQLASAYYTHSCDVVPGSTMYYIYGLQPRWENVTKEIFNLTKNGSSNRLWLVWKADKELSGRIIRLKATCNEGQRNVTGCLLLKAFGNVTYCRLDSDFVQRSVCPTPMNTSTIMPSLLPSSSSSSSFAMLQTTRTGQLTPVPSSYSPSQSGAISSTAHVPSSSHVPSTSTAEISTANPEESSNQVVSSSIYTPLVPPLKPSKSHTVTATSSPGNRSPGGGGGADAQKGDGDNGAVIGAAVGGAVFFTIVVIIIVVFCKRRKQKPTKDKKLQREVKNPVYGTTDNDISMTPNRQSQAMTSRDQDHPPVYQSPSKNNGHSTEQEVYENPESNYDNHPVYQSLDNKTAAAGQHPVYQSLQSGTTEPEYTYAKAEPSHAGKQSKPARPELGATDEQRKRSSVNSGPVNNEPNPTAEESLYNVLEGPDSDQDYEPVEGQGDAQEPLYNVLDGEAPDGSHSEPEPVYNVLDGPDPGEYEDAAYAAPGGPIPGGPVPPRAIENPAYEVTQEFGAPEASQYAAVERPGPERESAYEPLRRPNREDTYESLG